MSGSADVGDAGDLHAEERLSWIRCPLCALAVTECAHSLPRTGAFLDLRAADDRVPETVELVAAHRGYDAGVSWLAALFDEDEQVERRKLAEALRLEAGARVLDVCCGSGAGLSALRDAVGLGGTVVGLDVSPTMLELAVERQRNEPLAGAGTFVLGDARALPVVSGSFDAALHVGAIGQFENIAAAFSEVARVVRPGGRVVVCDEGVAPWLAERPYGKRLVRHSAEFAASPPLQCLPPVARDVSLSWVLGDAFWVIAFTVGSPRRLNDALLAQ